MNESLSGMVTMPKLLLDRDILLQEPANRRSALVDLWTWANDRPRTIKIAGRDVALQRGQLAYSQITLGKLWRWDKEKVRRTLVEFQNDGLITYDATNTTTIITVLDYPIYNLDSGEVSDTEPLPEPLPEPLAVPLPEPLQKCEVGRGKEERGGRAHEENPVNAGYCPDDANVLDFAANFAGEAATGTPGPMAPEFATGWLARMLGRWQFPVRWQRAMIGDWRAAWNKPEQWPVRPSPFAAASVGNRVQKKIGGELSQVEVISNSKRLTAVGFELREVEERLTALDQCGAELPQELKQKLAALEREQKQLQSV